MAWIVRDGFTPPTVGNTDPSQIQRFGTSQEGLVRRWKTRGPNPEGSFLACTCWLADCQAMQGRRAAAHETFERVLSVRNDLGLLAEEYNVAGRHLSGNFPQALSHLALVQTALHLSGPVLKRGRT